MYVPDDPLPELDESLLGFLVLARPVAELLLRFRFFLVCGWDLGILTLSVRGRGRKGVHKP